MCGQRGDKVFMIFVSLGVGVATDHAASADAGRARLGRHHAMTWKMPLMSCIGPLLPLKLDRCRYIGDHAMQPE